MMRLPKYISKPHTKNVFGELKEGYSYIKRTPEILFVIIMLMFISLFVLPYSTLIPFYARDVFHGTASTFGIIDSFIGLGAFSGAIFLASIRPGHDLKKILAINTLVFGAGLVLFSHENHYILALLFSALAGFGMMSQITISNTLLQTTADVKMRGRVISFYAMAFFGMQPLGGLLIGWISKWIGTKDTMLGEGVIALIIGMVHFMFLRRARLKTKRTPIIEPSTVDSAHIPA